MAEATPDNGSSFVAKGRLGIPDAVPAGHVTRKSATSAYAGSTGKSADRTPVSRDF